MKIGGQQKLNYQQTKVTEMMINKATEGRRTTYKADSGTGDDDMDNISSTDTYTDTQTDRQKGNEANRAGGDSRD